MPQELSLKLTDRHYVVAFDDENGGCVAQERELKGKHRLRIAVDQLAFLSDCHNLNKSMTIGQLLDMDQNCLLDSTQDLMRVITWPDAVRDY